MSEFAPSTQQSTIYDFIKHGKGSCVVEAVAGSGKTTTLINGLNLMTAKGRVFLGAYNKKIAAEIKLKAAPHPDLFISTFHAAGFSMWRKAYPRVVVEDKKCKNLLKKMKLMETLMQGDDAGVHLQTRSEQILSLVSYAKQAGFGCLKPIDSKEEWNKLITHFNVDCFSEEDYVIEKCQSLLRASIATDNEIIDFDDMILAPLVHRVRAYTYDWVLIDEAQDTNASRRALALKMLKPNGRLLAVGDRYQAIYGFTGADSDALDLISQQTKATHLPLSVSYRCPRAVVAYARQWVDHITASDAAPEGIVRTTDEAGVMRDIALGDVVLCRFNAPLVTMVYGFIAKGIPAKIEGREIGQNLKDIALRWKAASNYDRFVEKMEAWQEKETERFTKREEESRIEDLNDKIHCIKIIMNRAKKYRAEITNPCDAICEEIDSIFNDEIDGNYITLSSIHRSKGREWHRVFWLQTPPSHYAVMDWELEQEKNLKYVAATRAMFELVLFEADKKKKEQ